MEPVEINAGGWYLRAMRADERIDDRPALADLGEHDPGYIAAGTAGWAADTRYSWVVCEPTTGELLGEVVLDPVSAEITSRARRGHGEATRAATAAVSRFAAGALGLTALVAPASGGRAAGQHPADPADAGGQHD